MIYAARPEIAATEAAVAAPVIVLTKNTSPETDFLLFLLVLAQELSIDSKLGTRDE